MGKEYWQIVDRPKLQQQIIYATASRFKQTFCIQTRTGHNFLSRYDGATGSVRGYTSSAGVVRRSTF